MLTGLRIVAIHAVNWLTFLIGYTYSLAVDNGRFALIAANLYSMAFCDILSHDVKVTFCQIPRAVLGIDIVTWYQLDKGQTHCRLLFCITLGWYTMSVLKGRGQAARRVPQGTEEHKEEGKTNTTELDEHGNPKSTV